MASSSSGNRARLDQIAAEFLAKGLRVILDARLGSSGAAADAPTAASARPGSSHAGASARWFNLELGASGHEVLQAVEGWRRQARGEPLVLEILLVNTPTRAEPSVPAGGTQPLSAGPRQSLAGRAFASSDAFISLLGNVPVQAGFAPAAPGKLWQGSNSPAAGVHGGIPGRESSGGTAETVTLVERWVLSYERNLTPGMASTAGGAPSMGSMRASLGGSGGVPSRGLQGARCASAADVSFAGTGSPLATSGATVPGDTKEAGAGPEIPTVYKHLVVLLRSLYSLARVLPAYRLHTSLGSSSHKSDFRLTFRIGSTPAAGRPVSLGERPKHVQLQLPKHQHGEPQVLQEPASLDGSGLTNRISMDPVEMPGGRLAVSVAYCHTTTVTATEVSPPLIPHLIADYVGSPMTDSVRRYSQSDTPLSPAVVPRRAVHVIPIVSSGSAPQGSHPTLPSPLSFPSSPASLPTGHIFPSPAQGQGQRGASGPSPTLPGSRFPQARSLSGTAASSSPAYSPAPPMVPAGSSAPVHPTRTLTAGAVRPRAEAATGAEPAMSQSPSTTFSSERRSGLSFSPRPPSFALSLGTSSSQEQPCHQPHAQQALGPGQQGQQGQPRHQHWQQELLRQHQQEQLHGGGGWKASAPLSIPRQSARPGAVSLAEGQAGAERAVGSGSTPRSQGSGGPGSFGSQGADTRLGGAGLSRDSGLGTRESGLGFYTIGTAPHAVVQGPVPFFSGARPAQTWMPASAPGHAALHPGLGPVQVGGGARSRGEVDGRQWKADAPAAAPGRLQGQTVLAQGGGLGGISAAPSSALTAALVGSAARLPGHTALVSGLTGVAGATHGEGAAQVQRLSPGEAQEHPKGMQGQWGGYEAQQSSTSEMDITRQSRLLDDEADESAMDLPFAVDEDEDSTDLIGQKPASPSQGGHPPLSPALHQVPGTGRGAQAPGPPGLLWDVPTAQARGFPRVTSTGSGSSGLSASSGAQMRAAAVGALVRLLKSAPPLRMGTALEGAGGLGPADQPWRVDAGEGRSDLSARAVTPSQLYDAAVLGLGASWLSHSMASSVLAAPRQGLAAGAWQGLGKSMGAAAQELEAFRELRDALVRQKGDRPQRRQLPREPSTSAHPGHEEPPSSQLQLQQQQQQQHVMSSLGPGSDASSGSSRGRGNSAQQEGGESGRARAGSAARWYSFGKHTGSPC